MAGRKRTGSRERYWHWATVGVLWLLLLGFAVREWGRHGERFIAWDWMLLSGLVLFLVGAYAAWPLPRRLDRTIVALGRRQVLVAGATPIDEVADAFRAARPRWRLVGGLVASAAIAGAFALALADTWSPGLLRLGVLETLIAFPAGRYLGAMAHSSMLARVLARHKVAVVARPGAIDGAGGLRPIGDFFFRQATVVSLPAAYLALWLVLITLLDKRFGRYDHWVEPYSGLLLVALVFVVLAFVLPLLSFHRVMRRQKRDLQAHADAMAGRLNGLRDELVATQDRESRTRLREEIEVEAGLLREIEAMPVWPVAPATRRRFTLNNTVLSFPLVVQGLDRLGLGTAWLDWVGRHLG